LVEMAILSRAIYMFLPIPIKIPITSITEIKKSTLKFIWKHKRPWLAKVLLSKKSNAGWVKQIPHGYAHLIFDKVSKNIWWGKDNLFNKCFSEKWLFGCRTLKPDPCLLHCTSINSKWIKDLNIWPKTLQLEHKRSGNNRYRQGLPQ
jgi:hypothetical protein